MKPHGYSRLQGVFDQSILTDASKLGFDGIAASTLRRKADGVGLSIKAAILLEQTLPPMPPGSRC